MLKAVDCIAPKGDIERDMFPSDNAEQLEARVDPWLNEGDSRAAGLPDGDERDGAIIHFVYHKAYMAVFRRLSANPSSFTASDSGGHGYSTEQIRNFYNLAVAELSEFEALIPVVVGGVNTSTLPPHVTTRARVSW